MKKNKEIPIWVWVIIIALVLIIISLLPLNSNKEEIEIENDVAITYTSEYCTQLANEARIDMNNCHMEGLRNLYGIDYEADLDYGTGCYYRISSGYCISDDKGNAYWDLMTESCESNFPTEQDVFAECLSKIK